AAHRVDHPTTSAPERAHITMTVALLRPAQNGRSGGTVGARTGNERHEARDAPVSAGSVRSSFSLICVGTDEQQPGSGDRVHAYGHHRKTGDVQPCGRADEKDYGTGDQGHVERRATDGAQETERRWASASTSGP